MIRLSKFQNLALVPIWLYGTCLPLRASSGQEAIIPAQTHIQSVCMYPNEAWITRSGTLQLSAPGKHRFSISRLPASLSFDDLRITANGPAGTRLGEISLQAWNADPSETPEQKRLTNEREKHELRKSQLEDIKKALDQARQLAEAVKANQIQAMQRLLATENLKPKTVLEFADSLEVRSLELSRQQPELESAIAEEETTLQRIQEALNRMRDETSSQPGILHAKIDVPRDCEVEVFLSYRCRSASWHPVYEARLSEDRSRLEWMISAAARQDTGEKWSSVELDFFTGNPEQSLALPAASNLPNLSYHEEHVPSVLPWLPATSTTSPGFARLKTPSRVEVYPGKEQRFRLATLELKPSFRYLAIPRSTSNVFLVAQVHPTPEFPLVSGSPVQLLQGNERLGTSNLDLPLPGEPLRLSFGPVPGLQARHRVIQKGHGETTSKPPQREWSFTEQFIVENSLSSSVEVDVQDRTVSSGTDSVKIEQISEPVSNSDRARPSLQTWTLRLEPGGRAEVLLKTRIQGPLVGRLTNSGDLALEGNQ